MLLSGTALDGGHAIAENIVRFAALYVLAGSVFAAAFVARGVQRIDPGAVGAGWRFRLIIAPGVVALWPLLLRRWLTRSAAPDEDNAHRRAARERAP